MNDTEEFPEYIGTCGHSLSEEWYNSDDSSYTVLDEPSGAYVYVTTCPDCKVENQNIIVDPDEISFDFDEELFADDTAPKTVVLFNEDGSYEVIEGDKVD